MTHDPKTMKVLLVHNYYQSSAPSGEDVVFKNEVELLKNNGIDVITYTKHNDDAIRMNKIGLAFKMIWSYQTFKDLKRLIKKEKPDIAHFHNIWYLISPSAYYACKEAGVPVVQTLHNFRIFCANGLSMRNGKICEECIAKKTGHRSGVMGDRLKIIQNAIKYGCYRNSKIYSFPIALMQYFHWVKKTWVDKVDAYIALTEFGKRKFIEAGLSEEKIFVKPNFLADPPEPDYSHRNYAVFLGRISAEKGISILINAFQHLSSLTHNPSPITHHPFHLKIIGDGPLMDSLQHLVRAENIKNIEFTGRKIFDDAMELLSGAKLMIMPSICYETFGLTIVESFACGKPVVASRLGSLAELVKEGKTGLLFEPGNPEDLALKIKWMIDHENECIEMGKNARKAFEEKYTAERNYEILMNVYQKVINNHKDLRRTNK